MRALRFARTGALDALNVEEVDPPRGDDEFAVVAVRAAGINPSDAKNVLGGFGHTTVPRTPGRDYAGVVVEGPRALIGKHVWGSGSELGFTVDGTHAERVRVPAASLRELPRTLDFVEAAALPVPLVTAWLALDGAAPKAEETLVVIGAAGAVGSAAVQLGRWRGLRVVGVVRKAAQRESVSAHGAARVVDSSVEDVSAVLRGLGGADIVIDAAGERDLDGMVAWLKPRGRVALLTATAPVTFDIKTLYRKEARIHGVNSLAHDATATAALLDALAGAFAGGAVRAPAIERCTLDGARTAYERVLAGAEKKLVLTFDP